MFLKLKHTNSSSIFWKIKKKKTEEERKEENKKLLIFLQTFPIGFGSGLFHWFLTGRAYPTLEKSWISETKSSLSKQHWVWVVIGPRGVQARIFFFCFIFWFFLQKTRLFSHLKFSLNTKRLLFSPSVKTTRVLA